MVTARGRSFVVTGRSWLGTPHAGRLTAGELLGAARRSRARRRPWAVPAGIIVAAAVDQLVGEPPARWHPVVWFGSTMARVEARLRSDDRVDERLLGAVHAATGISIATGTAALLRRSFGPTAAAAIATSVAIAGRMLDEEAHAVAAALESDLELARDRIGRLVGRDTTELDHEQIARATIESVAENTVDAVLASMWWGAIGGATGVLVHRAVNTLDAMVGHRSDRYRRYGWASARLDDALNWIPARLGAASVWAISPRRRRSVVRAVRDDAPGHPSPNGGVIEAAFAAALGVSLGGTNVYEGTVEDRGVLGDGRAVRPADIGRAVRLAGRVQATTLVACVVIATAVRSQVSLPVGRS